MADLERIQPMSEAQLKNVCSGTLQDSPRRLNDEDYQILLVLVGQMMQRYPSQDLEQSIEGYMADFEQLAMRYSLLKVRNALAELRIRAGQKFFPRPDEVAEEIERQREQGVLDAKRRDGEAWLKGYMEHMRSLWNPEEVAWRVQHFGYDPFTSEEVNHGKHDDIEAGTKELVREHDSGLDESDDLPWGQNGQDAPGSLRETVGARKQ